MTLAYDEDRFDRAVERLVRKANSHRTDPADTPKDASESTYLAALYELRTHGVARLGESNCQRRLGELSTDQVGKLVEALSRLKPNYAAITDELISKLGDFK